MKNVMFILTLLNSYQLELVRNYFVAMGPS